MDYLLASQGGTCAIVSQECCTYILDASENITNLADHIKRQADQLQEVGRKFHDYNPPGWLGWLGHGLFDWIFKAFMLLLILLLGIGLLGCLCKCIVNRVVDIPIGCRDMTKGGNVKLYKLSSGMMGKLVNYSA